MNLLIEEHNLNFNVITYNHSKIPPWKTPCVEFCKELVGFKKSQVADSEMRALFYEHFEDHKDSVPIYTDGSKCQDGVGFATVFPNLTIKRRLHNCASVFSAELYAILLALKFLITMREQSFVIVSDSRSALLAIEAYNSKHPLIMEIQQWLYFIFSKHKKVEFCWVPSHTGISSNEKADENAKTAVHEMQICDKNLPYTDYYSVIDNALTKEWQREWSDVRMNKLRRVKCTVLTWPSSCHKNRQWEVVLARLRLGHTRVTHKHLMEKGPVPRCANCNVELTVEHILIECSLYMSE